MKKSLLIFTLLFSTMMFSSTSFAKWTIVGDDLKGWAYYVDFERIREHGGYVYYWYLVDLLKPTKYGHLSSQVYNQGDCKIFRLKSLSLIHHKQPMGLDTGEGNSPKNPEWDYPTPYSPRGAILKTVCDRVK